MKTSTPNVLVLGSGFVAQAIGDYFSKYTQFFATFATIDKASGQRICEMSPNRFRLEILNAVDQPEKLAELCSSHDIVMSLFPPPLHKYVAKVCIKMNKNMVTSSYISNGKLCYFFE